MASKSVHQERELMTITKISKNHFRSLGKSHNQKEEHPLLKLKDRV